MEWITKAIELGCPHIVLMHVDDITNTEDDETMAPCFVVDPGEDQWSFMGEYFGEHITDGCMMSRFACGATVSLWASNKIDVLLEAKPETHENADMVENLMQIRDAAEAFALKG